VLYSGSFLEATSIVSPPVGSYCLHPPSPHTYNFYCYFEVNMDYPTASWTFFYQLFWNIIFGVNSTRFFHRPDDLPIMQQCQITEINYHYHLLLLCTNVDSFLQPTEGRKDAALAHYRAWVGTDPSCLFSRTFQELYAFLLLNYSNNLRVTINKEPAQCCCYIVSSTTMHNVK